MGPGPARSWILMEWREGKREGKGKGKSCRELRVTNASARRQARAASATLCPLEIPVPFDPADPGVFPFDGHSQSPPVHRDFHLMLGQKPGSRDGSG